MNKMNRYGLATALALGLSMAAGGGLARELKASNHLPPKNNAVADGYVPFAAEVKEKSGGALTVKTFAGGSILGPKAASEGIRDGVVDLGYVIVGYHPAEFPRMAFLNDMAAIGTNAVTVSAATTELMLLECPECLTEFMARGNVYMGSASSPPMVIMSSKKIDTVDDFRGLKIRSGGAAWDRFVHSVHGTPVNIPSSEQFEALSRGTIDASFHLAASLKTYGIWDIVKDVVPVNVGAYRALNVFAFNPGSWQSLSDAERAIVFEAAMNATLNIADAYLATDKEALAGAEEHGFRLKEMDPTVKQAVADFAVAEAAGLVKLGKEERGIADPQALIDKMTRLVAKWDGIYAEVGGDIGAMKQRFHSEVTEKVDLTAYGR